MLVPSSGKAFFDILNSWRRRTQDSVHPSVQYVQTHMMPCNAVIYIGKIPRKVFVRKYWGLSLNLRLPFVFHHLKTDWPVVFHGSSNGNASETKANESFDNGVFFDIEAKRTPSIVN
jgi:hypothetical protein